MAVALAGCSREDVDKLVEQVKDQTQSASQSLTEEIQKAIPTGELRLSMGGDIIIPNAWATLSVVGDGRPNMLQIKSYRQMTSEKFPSVLIHGPVKTDAYTGLVGQTFTGEIHVNIDGKSNLWQSDPESKATITITSSTESELIGQVSAAMKSVDGKTGSLSGTFRALK